MNSAINFFLTWFTKFNYKRLKGKGGEGGAVTFLNSHTNTKLQMLVLVTVSFVFARLRVAHINRILHSLVANRWI